MSALSSDEPLAVMYALPGPVPLRLFLTAAADHGTSTSSIDLARRSVDEFDALLSEYFEDRSELDALLGTSIRDARRRSEAAAKQAMFRGAVGIKGVSCEAACVGFMIHPSPTQSGWCDTLMVGGMIGLRRLRPGVNIEYTSDLAESDHVRAPLGRTPDGDSLLREFCSPQRLPIESIVESRRVRYRLTGDAVGLRSAINLMLAEYYPANHPLQPVLDRPRVRYVYATIEQPVRRLVLDAFIHRDVWPKTTPSLAIFDTVLQGLADPVDPGQAARRLDLAESVEQIGTGISCARHKSLPRYTEALMSVAAGLGWDHKAFRTFRCEILYPVYGSQVCILFDLHRPDLG